MQLGLLAGNSRLRFGLFENGRLLDTAALFWERLEDEGPEALAELASRGRIDGVVAASVRDDLLERALAFLPPGLPSVRVARRDFEVPIENLYERPAEVGVDRLLNALAARERWPGTHAIVVDFGTALSLSVVSGDGAFLGGMIGAGSSAAARALRESTPLLPRVDPAPSERFLQRSTAAALSAGLYWQFIGGVQLLLDGLRDELPSTVRLIATGGEAERYTPALLDIECVDPDLALRGLALAVSREIAR